MSLPLNQQHAQPQGFYPRLCERVAAGLGLSSLAGRQCIHVCAHG